MTEHQKDQLIKVRQIKYCKVASSNTSCLEAHAGFFRLLKKGIFNPYVLGAFEKYDFLISNEH